MQNICMKWKYLLYLFVFLQLPEGENKKLDFLEEFLPQVLADLEKAD